MPVSSGTGCGFGLRRSIPNRSLSTPHHPHCTPTPGRRDCSPSQVVASQVTRTRPSVRHCCGNLLPLPPGTFLACHPNHIANVVAIVSTTQQYIPLREREKDVDQSAAAHADSMAIDVSTELPVHTHSDTEEERHPAPRGVQMRMGEAFSRLCHCSVPLGPLVAAYGGKIAAPLRMVSRKSPGAQRALNRLMSVVGSPLRSRVCKALEGLDVPDGK